MTPTEKLRELRAAYENHATFNDPLPDFAYDAIRMAELMLPIVEYIAGIEAEDSSLGMDYECPGLRKEAKQALSEIERLCEG